MNADDELGIPSADGIRRCLRLLADEAAELKLNSTFSAIEAALAVIAAETRPGGFSPKMTARHGYLLH